MSIRCRFLFFLKTAFYTLFPCVFYFAFLFRININYKIMQNTCVIQNSVVYLYYNYNEVII